LRLPISPVLSRNRDSLQVRDVIREVELVRFLPEIEIYQKLIDALEKRGGYAEGNGTLRRRPVMKTLFTFFRMTGVTITSKTRGF
jgi:hypothetical protein